MTRSPVVLSAPTKNGAIRVGSQFQASIPECNEDKSQSMKVSHDATCVFSAERAEAVLTDEEVTKVIATGRKSNFDEAQSLVFLHLKKYNLNRTIDIMPLYGPFPEIWDAEDIKMYCDGLAQYGKDFLKVQEFIPHKTRQELVSYYYSMKKKMHFKTPHRKRRRKISLGGDRNDGGSDSSSNQSDSPSEENSDSEIDDSSVQSSPSSEVERPRPARVTTPKRYKRQNKRNYNSIKNDDIVQASDELKTESSPSKICRRGIPPDFHMDVEEFRSFMNQSETTMNTGLRRVTQEYEKAKNDHLQLVKKIDKLVPSAVESVSQLRPDATLFTPTPHWSPREIMLILVTFERFGADCEKAASIIGTKTVEQVIEYDELMREKLSNYDKLFNKNK